MLYAYKGVSHGTDLSLQEACSLRTDTYVVDDHIHESDLSSCLCKEVFL